MRSLDEFATAKLGELERGSLRRALVDTTRVTGIWTLRNGRRLLSFSCNDYLNLTHHPAIKEAAIEALEIYGVGAAASRFVTGNHPLYAELEARTLGVDDRVFFLIGPHSGHEIERGAVEHRSKHGLRLLVIEA